VIQERAVIQKWDMTTLKSEKEV